MSEGQLSDLLVRVYSMLARSNRLSLWVRQNPTGRGIPEDLALDIWDLYETQCDLEFFLRDPLDAPRIPESMKEAIKKAASEMRGL